MLYERRFNVLATLLATMGKLNTFLWVPQPVADFVATALLEPHDQPGLDRLQCLITSLDMQPVWKTLSSSTTESELLIAFMERDCC